MLKTIAPSLVSGALNMVSSSRQYSRQKELLKKQQEYQTQERLSSQQWQQRMYDLQNRYNSPVAVMARLKEAGISPDMYYSGAGNVAASVPGSTAGGAPSVPTPAGESSMIQGANALGDAALKASYIKNIDADTRNKESDTSNKDILGVIQGMQIPLIGLQQKKTAQEIKNMQQEFRVLTETADKISVEKMTSAQQLLEMKDTYLLRKRSIKLSNDNLASNNKHLQQQIDRYTEIVEASIESLNAQTYGNWVDALDKEFMLQAKNAREGDYYADALDLQIGLMKANVSQIQTAVEKMQNYAGLDAWSRAIGNVLGGLAAGVVAGVAVKNAMPPAKKPPIGYNR